MQKFVCVSTFVLFCAFLFLEVRLFHCSVNMLIRFVSVGLCMLSGEQLFVCVCVCMCLCVCVCCELGL